MMLKRRVGIVGYGNLGQYLVAEVRKRFDLELVFVWNRNSSVLYGEVDPALILENLDDFNTFKADLIVEVAHPDISHGYGSQFLATADYMIGSPTALSEAKTEVALRRAASEHGLYVPTGAFWGGEDIKKMADRGTLKALKVTMKKHPSSFRLHEELAVLNLTASIEPVTLFHGSVRDLCPLAPNNVNTMATASIAAHNLGFDGVECCLIADSSLVDCHIVEIEVWGIGRTETSEPFTAHTIRRNPASVGAVTGTATYASFLSSLIGAHGKGPGVHLC